MMIEGRAFLQSETGDRPVSIEAKERLAPNKAGDRPAQNKSKDLGDRQPLDFRAPMRMTTQA
jgi:hypothetical protein